MKNRKYSQKRKKAEDLTNEYYELFESQMW